jgi:hypothetical protein
MKYIRFAQTFCTVVLSATLLINTAGAKDSYSDFDKPYSQRPPRAAASQSSSTKPVNMHKVYANKDTASAKAQQAGHSSGKSDILMPGSRLTDPNYTPDARAKYWKTQGYDFDPNKMTAFAMDDRAANLDRAKYWKTKGHAFDANQMTALDMDQRVADLDRAKYWKDRGFNFDPNTMSTSSTLHSATSKK